MDELSDCVAAAAAAAADVVLSVVLLVLEVPVVDAVDVLVPACAIELYKPAAS